MKLIPVPRGMSPGFYAFMGAGCRRSDSGEMMMLAPTRKETSMILKCFNGPMAGAVYHLDNREPNTTRKPDGLWFNGQDEDGRWVMHQYVESGKLDMTDGEIVLQFMYDGQVEDVTTPPPEEVEHPAFAFREKVANRPTVPGEVIEHQHEHGCKDCGEERIPRIVAGKATCPECGSENLVNIAPVMNRPLALHEQQDLFTQMGKWLSDNPTAKEKRLLRPEIENVYRMQATIVALQKEIAAGDTAIRQLEYAVHDRPTVPDEVAEHVRLTPRKPMHEPCANASCPICNRRYEAEKQSYDDLAASGGIVDAP